MINQCDGCLVPLAKRLMAGGCGFASHGGITQSRGWLCQRWKPLEIPGTHLLQAMLLLTKMSKKLPPASKMWEMLAKRTSWISHFFSPGYTRESMITIVRWTDKLTSLSYIIILIHTFSFLTIVTNLSLYSWTSGWENLWDEAWIPHTSWKTLWGAIIYTVVDHK